MTFNFIYPNFKHQELMDADISQWPNSNASLIPSNSTSSKMLTNFPNKSMFQEASPSSSMLTLQPSAATAQLQEEPSTPQTRIQLSGLDVNKPTSDQQLNPESAGQIRQRESETGDLHYLTSEEEAAVEAYRQQMSRAQARRPNNSAAMAQLVASQTNPSNLRANTKDNTMAVVTAHWFNTITKPGTNFAVAYGQCKNPRCTVYAYQNPMKLDCEGNPHISFNGGQRIWSANVFDPISGTTISAPKK
jgi:hypothetical protein